MILGLLFFYFNYLSWSDPKHTDPKHTRKNEKLKAERGIGFEEVIIHIERDDLLDVVAHPNQLHYPNQKILVVKIRDYVYLVPFAEDEEGKFLKTMIPSRKATRDYLGA